MRGLVLVIDKQQFFALLGVGEADAAGEVGASATMRQKPISASSSSRRAKSGANCAE
jgi:hypothetical protein